MIETNPFKFGSIVDDPFFTDRVHEQKEIRSILQSSVHLVIISPRRYGKTSLIKKVVAGFNRPLIFFDLQLVTDVHDLASQLLRKVYKVYPFEKIKDILKHFRIVPSINLNPQTNEVDITFQPKTDILPLLEDVFNLLDRLGNEKNKPIVVLDEFQEIKLLSPNLDKQLRAIIQLHRNVNYVFMGSVESMMRDIFEKKKSPFYHFGQLMPLDKIPYTDFHDFISNGFKRQTDSHQLVAGAILEITNCHPYYTQQLAYNVWNKWDAQKPLQQLITEVINYLIQIHDMDFQRLWQNQNQTDKKILLSIANDIQNLLSQANIQAMGFSASSTLFSGLKRLTAQGLIIKTEGQYQFDDPFFKKWIITRRNEN